MATIQSNPSAIELADRAQRRIVVLSIVFGVVAALIAALLAWLVWRSSNKYQDAVKADADARIATADSRAAEANAKAAEANEGLGKSNEEIARLTKEAEALRADAEQARANIATAQTDAAQANERTQKLAIEAAQARRRQAEAERLLLEVKERGDPRRLTEEQAQKLREFLRDKPKGRLEIVFAAGNNEALNFAIDLYMQALMGSGWQVTHPRPDSSLRSGSGLQVDAANIGEGSPAELLRQALVFAGIPTAAAANRDVPEGTVILFIGQRFVSPLPK